MSKRGDYAATIMSGMVASITINGQCNTSLEDMYAKDAIYLADALIRNLRVVPDPAVTQAAWEKSLKENEE